jgi:peptidoglycan-associated lipoprotein
MRARALLTMRARAVLTVALATTVAFSAGCKKPTPPETPIVAPPPPPAPPAPAVVPEPVVQMARNFQRVYFDLDSATLASASKAALDENVALMQANPDIKVELQGHADERGTTDYNLALGQRRADAVRRYLGAQGIAGSRFSVVSFGEERPLQSGSSESAWSQNRRAEFRITWGEGAAVRGTTN